MNTQDQFKALAEWEGWTTVCDVGHPTGRPMGYPPGEARQGFENRFVPDYNSLAVLWQCEERLNPIERLSFYRLIRDLFATVVGIKGSVIGVNDFLIVHATADQRREALLKTLGLWKEGE